ncbi:MAG: glycosyl hydrolase family 8 [Pseudomonadota bacterium]
MRTTLLSRSVFVLACGLCAAACSASGAITGAAVEGNSTAGEGSAAGSGPLGHPGSAGAGGQQVVAIAGANGNSGGAPSTTFGGSTSAGGKPASGSAGSPGDSGGSAGSSSPAAGCTPPATYTNLFVTVSGHTQAESDAKITAAWSQYFNPSGANTVYYNGPGADESYVKDVANNDVRTEGQSYGMMIAVQLDHQTEFDRLWAFVKNHMLSGKEIAWHTSTSGSKLASGGAPDGDEYFAAALVFASKRWGDTSGKYNYASEAKTILNLIRTQDFNDKAKLVQFYAGSGNTDGSYVLPAFYQSWACFDTENAAFWNSAVTAGRAFFKAAVDSNGVIGDQSSFTGQTQKGAGSDTVRCVMNIMMDHNFFKADPWQETYASKYGAYVSKGTGSTAQLSCNGLLGFGLPAATGKPFVDKLWSVAMPTGQYRYYDGTLYFLALLHVSGTFHLWY